jgi:hypothetical protein
VGGRETRERLAMSSLYSWRFVKSPPYREEPCEVHPARSPGVPGNLDSRFREFPAGRADRPAKMLEWFGSRAIPLAGGIALLAINTVTAA